MVGKFDGTVRIDTRVDTAGFNAGIRKVGASAASALGKVVAALVTIATVAAAVAAAIATIGLAILGIGAAIVGGIVRSSAEAFIGLEGNVQDLKFAIQDLKNAFAIMLAPLVTLAIPYIKSVIAWLVNLMNHVAMVIAALLGQKTVWQAVLGGAEAASNAADELAKNTAKAKKEAQGALAPWDELSILSKQGAEDVADPAKLAALDTLAFKMTEVTTAAKDSAAELKRLWDQGLITNVLQGLDKMLTDIFGDRWVNFRDWVLRAVQDIQTWFANLWQGIVDNWNTRLAEAQLQWVAFRQFMADLWQGIVDNWNTRLNEARQQWADLRAWLVELWQGIVDNWNTRMDEVRQQWTEVSGWFMRTWADIRDRVTEVWRAVTAAASDAWSGVQARWGNAVAWFTGIAEGIRGAFGTALTWVRDRWDEVWGGLTGTVRSFGNRIIDFVNRMIVAIANGINVLIDALNAIQISVPSILGQPGFTFGVNLPRVSPASIPYLAAGAVIPPNAQFAAILGDQRSGTNIEAPESLIRQIIQEELANNPQAISVRFEGSLGALIREMKPVIDRETTRMGTSLVTRSET